VIQPQQGSGLSLVWAMSENGVIGSGGTLPWSLPDDLAHFKRLTHGHPVLMGRRTWDSLWLRPLPGRLNIVLTRNPTFSADGAQVVTSLDQAFELGTTYRMFCIGGAILFDEVMHRADRLEVTLVHAEVDGDVYMPSVDWSDWALTEETLHPADDRHAYAFSFRSYERIDD